MSISTRKRKDGSTAYYVRLRRPDGTRYQATLNTKDEAKTWKAEQIADRARNKWVDPNAGRIPLREYVEEWLETRELKPSTRQTYDSQLTHILPTFGDTSLNAISRRAVRRWYARVSREVSPLQAAKCYRLLMAVLNTAAEDEIIGANRCRIKGAAQEASPERPLVPLDLALAIADAITRRFRLLVLLVIGCGLRLGELMGLRRRDVDLLHRKLWVLEQKQELKELGIVRTEPKTDAGKRDVEIPAFLVPEIEEHLATFVGADPDAPLFTGPRGGERRATVYRAWRRAIAAVGLPPGTHIHDLRHLSHTLAAKAPGKTLKDLMKRGGWTSERAALRYLHAADDAGAAMADEIDAAVQNARTPRPESRSKPA